MKIMVISRGYPSPERIYNHGFVHRRVLAYRALGHEVSVIWLHHRPPRDRYAFDGVEVLMRTAAQVLELVASDPPAAVALHAPGDDFAPIIENVPPAIPVNGWIYGAEIMPFYEVTERKEHNLARWEKAQATFNRRIAYWRALAEQWPANFRLVFVSQFAADSAAQAIGREIPRMAVLPSPVDTGLFAYRPKPPEQRFEVLSVRPFSDWRYANDLSAAAIVLMSGHPLFERFRFRLRGEGHLFEEMVAPIRHFPNVEVEQAFVTQPQVAALHATAGIFLCPTRNDAQGVSRDEAMSSGLVPVTNAVGAVPEFADRSCAWLAPAENHHALAEGLLALAQEPDRFQAMSEAAASRVRETLAIDIIVKRELALMHRD